MSRSAGPARPPPGRSGGFRDRIRGSVVWTVGGHVGTETIRLLGNLVLTRLLFPEAFGLMALITAVMIGLRLFSDIGIAPAIQQSPRGDDPDFLNTAWTIQIMRGVLLWLSACALAIPMAALYGTPELMQLLPVAALALLVGGFRPTRFETASRHMRMARVTVINLSAQALGLGVMVLLAVLTRSVWALAIGMVITEALRVLALHIFMPGHVDQLRIDRSAARELIRFGKWIFLSTACAFAISQGDRLILGYYLTLEILGIFSIGYFIGSFPRVLGMTVLERLMIPIYRDRPPARSRENFLALRRLRDMFTAGLMAIVLVLALVGPWLVSVLYDARYVMAGPVVVMLSVIVLLQLVGMSYDRAALAAGDSRRYFWLQAARAVSQTVFLMIGAHLAGLGGALAGQALAIVATYGLQLRLARRHGVWDMRHDCLAALGALVIGTLAIWLHVDIVATLFVTGG
ncbi:MAG: polysaccharide biosynthesis protein [Rhodobacteraceae bacterium]|nr:MAG: polysaccharide biosynthesis protein [Paracoccaceae bacterium]